MDLKTSNPANRRIVVSELDDGEFIALTVMPTNGDTVGLASFLVPDEARQLADALHAAAGGPGPS